jgi:hypothetical protein
VARGLKLRHDHGSNYMSGDFQDEIECLGIEASPSFVREPEGNGVAERFIRTLKENLLWVRTFDTIEELRAALVEFATHYNETWLVALPGCWTPPISSPQGWPVMGIPNQSIRGRRYHLRDWLEGPLSHRRPRLHLRGSRYRSGLNHPWLPDASAQIGQSWNFKYVWLDVR